MAAVKEYRLKRLKETPETTAGEWLDVASGAPVVAVLERGAKVDHPRIPAGKYQLMMKVGGSKFDERYGNRFKWFKGMIEVTGVPGRSDILIHTGNRWTDSEGCLLVGTTPPGALATDAGFQLQAGTSAPAFELLYRRLYDDLGAGVVFVTVTDIEEPAA